MAEQFDLVVIGGGPGGYSAVLYAASAGLKAAMVEKDALGGTCLNRGCIPAKAFLETAAVYRHVDHAADFGIEASAPKVNFAVTQSASRRSSPASSAGSRRCARTARSRCSTASAGSAPTARSRWRSATGQTAEITGDNVILATGSVPRLIPNFERGGPIMTSDEVLDIDYVPDRVAVIGGGAIGCEFASTFADLGAEVTILEALPKILPGLDNDVANVVVRSVQEEEDRHPHRRPGHRPHAEGQGRHGGHVRRQRGAQGRCRDRLGGPAAVRRRARSRGHGVVVDQRGFVEVDEFCRTGEPGVYAIGDLIDTPQLAHVGYAEAILVVKQALGEDADAGAVRPGAVGDLLPPGGGVGRPGRGGGKEAGIDVVVAKHPFKSNSRAQILGETDGLAKIIAEVGRDGAPAAFSACTWSVRG